MSSNSGDSVKICSTSVMGTKYVRDTPAPGLFSIKSGARFGFSLAKIYADNDYRIGNVLDIRLR